MKLGNTATRGAMVITGCLVLAGMLAAQDIRLTERLVQGEDGRAVYILAQAAPNQQASPFEDVAAPDEPQAPASPFEDVTPADPNQQPSPFNDVEGPDQPTAGGDFVEDVEFRGARRVPRDSLLARIFTKKGDSYDLAGLRRDYMVLWNTGYFDDLRLEIEDGEVGKIVRFVVTERRIVRTIRYEGNKSATISDILERFSERNVGLSVESRYDPTIVQRALVVLRELLGERGRQYAVVEPQVRQIPPSSVEIVFQIEEGPKVKMGKIEIEGNTSLSDRQLKSAQKALKPTGIPKSIILENLFAKTFDIQKLEADKELMRNEYQINGFFRASVPTHELAIEDLTGRKLLPIPFIWKKKAKKANVKVFVEEGRQYRRGRLSFTDVALFRSPEDILTPVFRMEENAIFNVESLRDGLENLKKLYGEFGYIDFVAEPTFEFRDAEDPPLIDLNLTVDEGKQFFVRRINFSGNNTTRDKVIRRELLLDEGDMFNTRLWDLSILRLNQLGYFDPLEQEEATNISRDTRNGLVDLTLDVKERGRNTVSLNGGVSGFAGSFIGFGYSTNNFLGMGETLSFTTQLGSRERVISFGFTEPYLFDRPIQAGFTVFSRRFSFNSAREASIFSGRDLTSFFGEGNILDYRQNSTGFTTFLSYPMKRNFSRVGLTYSYQISDIQTFGDTTQNYFNFLNFQGVTGPNSLEGITTSEITPNFFHNTVDHPITPSRGKSLFASIAMAGVGGNTKFIQPTVEFKYFKPHTSRRNVIAMRVLGSLLTGYGGSVPPPFRRSFMGGENDIRGFRLFQVTPVAWIPDSAVVPLLNDNGTQRTQSQIINGIEQQVPVTTSVPVFRPIQPGGDTRFVFNGEYRIKLFGPVILAPFFDIGFNKIIFTDQVRLNSGRVADLNATFPQAEIEERIRVVSATQKVRASTGLEVQVVLPILQAPFRVYWAYNPLRVSDVLQPPIVADRALFPNQRSFVQGITRFATPFPYVEDKSTFRFTISRTF
ncbi:MAG: outer membrane protein assembly factor BamA [Acidobacteria bacterium]|nr:outer membrane protein assembly factor BamA [Acidobacteriota bacterium]